MEGVLLLGDRFINLSQVIGFRFYKYESLEDIFVDFRFMNEKYNESFKLADYRKNKSLIDDGKLNLKECFNYLMSLKVTDERKVEL